MKHSLNITRNIVNMLSEKRYPLCQIETVIGLSPFVDLDSNIFLFVYIRYLIFYNINICYMSFLVRAHQVNLLINTCLISKGHAPDMIILKKNSANQISKIVHVCFHHDSTL